MEIEKLLKDLFDFQRFERCPALRSVIDETEERYFGEELSDDALAGLFAAGDLYSQMPDPRKKDEPL